MSILFTNYPKVLKDPVKEQKEHNNSKELAECYSVNTWLEGDGFMNAAACQPHG